MEWSKYNFLFQSERYGNFLYNSMTNRLLEIDDVHYNRLERLKNGGNGLDQHSEFFSLLRECKVLVEEGEEERLLLAHHQKRLELCFNSSRLNLTLCPTLGCNFRCSYCYEDTQKDITSMSEETMDRLIDFIKQYKDIRNLSLTWYGGEPLLKFHCICDMTEKMEALGVNFKWVGLITNGYLLDSKKIALLNDLHITSIQITIDGPEKIHDSRRVLANGGPTFGRILDNVEELLNSDYRGKCAIRVNIDRNNFQGYFQLRNDLLERFKGKDLYIYASWVDMESAQSCDTSCGLDQREWADFTLELFERGGIQPLGSFYPRINLYSTCTATISQGFVVGPEGEIYKCFMDVGKPSMVVGNVHAKNPINNPVLQAQYCVGTDGYNDPICKECRVLPICGGGCANQRLQAKQFGEKQEYCSLFKGHLISYLEAYIDTVRSLEIYNLLSEEKGEEDKSPFKDISPNM